MINVWLSMWLEREQEKIDPMEAILALQEAQRYWQEFGSIEWYHGFGSNGSKCLVTAINYSGRPEDDFPKGAEFPKPLAVLSPVPKPYASWFDWNDAPERTFDEVVAVYDTAIAFWREKLLESRGYERDNEQASRESSAPE